MRPGREQKKLAVWAITNNGRNLACQVLDKAGRGDLHLSSTVADPPAGAHLFDSLAPCVQKRLTRYQGHVFIMATGIVVRVIAPFLSHKAKDPAVVVVDDAGRFCVSLVSGHLGGANDLANKIAQWIGAVPVITTATDAHGLPSVDILARDHGLVIENPKAIKFVNRAILEGQPAALADPFGFMKDAPLEYFRRIDDGSGMPPGEPGVRVSDAIEASGPETLVLRPKTLCVGMGCRRGVPGEELKNFLEEVFESMGLSTKSILCLATIDIKADEAGILWLARQLNAKIRLYSSRKLSCVKHVPNPSSRVQHHIGVESVCEAAAMTAANTQRLLVTKKKSRNATMAVARLSCSSSG